MAREGEGFALETQLHVAARGGEVERLKRLILQRADVNKAAPKLGVMTCYTWYIYICVHAWYVYIYICVYIYILIYIPWGSGIDPNQYQPYFFYWYWFGPFLLIFSIGVEKSHFHQKYWFFYWFQYWFSILIWKVFFGHFCWLIL